MLEFILLLYKYSHKMIDKMMIPFLWGRDYDAIFLILKRAAILSPIFGKMFFNIPTSCRCYIGQKQLIMAIFKYYPFHESA